MGSNCGLEIYVSTSTVPDAHYFNCRLFLNDSIDNSIRALQDFAQCFQLSFAKNLAQPGMIREHFYVLDDFFANTFRDNWIIESNIRYYFFKVLLRARGEEDRDAHVEIFTFTSAKGIL
jgi:hypothetical protein